MKDAYEVLQQKEADLARVHREIESLRLVASLLSEDETSEELTKSASSAEELDRGAGSEATGTDGLFSSIAVLRPRFGKL